MVASASKELKKDLLIEDFAKYRFLSNGNVNVASLDNAALFAELNAAMDIMGFSKDEQHCEYTRESPSSPR